ncbi:MAG: hypothetical protein ACFFEF_05780 [Candidatus Thorarchaeota archaeon]
MSKEKKNVQTASTVEAIRMASASILGTTTSQGYPLGSATGSGSKMEENSEAVAMNIAPLIFSLRDEVAAAEGLNLLSLEWDLERTPGPEILPEHLIITGGKSGDVSSHICALGWEKGVIDPFKMDEYMGRIAKKISDVEKAVIGNGIEYESDGLAILRKFSNRFNSVIFVEMLERQFQETWESQRIKPESVDIESIIEFRFRDDFSSNPPGPKIQQRTLIDFRLPEGSEEERLLHFRHRILSPRGLAAISSRIPDMGRAILTELNEYAYSIEEVEIAQSTIEALVEFLGKDQIQPDELSVLASSSKQFAQKMSEAANLFGILVDEHSTSGLRLTLDGHHERILAAIEQKSNALDELQIKYSKTLLHHLSASIERGFPTSDEIRAWELKSTFSYFVAVIKRVLSYLTHELQQFLLFSSVKRVLRETLEEFRNDSDMEQMDATEKLLFHKFYAELYSLLNAIIDRKSSIDSDSSNINHIVESITKEVSEEFKRIDVWDIIGFSDLAEIARAEIESYENNIESKVTRDSLTNLLQQYEEFVSQTLPDVGEKFISRDWFNSAIDAATKNGSTVLDFLRSSISEESEKTADWREEAMTWAGLLNERVSDSMPVSEQLFTFLKLAYERLGEGATPTAVLERIRISDQKLHDQYENNVNTWKALCSEIDRENEPIRENNKRREILLTEAITNCEHETREYEISLQNFQKKMEEYNSQPIPNEMPRPTEPSIPESLESRKARIDSQYPLQAEREYPPEPTQSEEMQTYSVLRELLDRKLEKMERSQERMEQVFTLKLRALKSEGAKITEGIAIGLSTEFLEFLMNAAVRKLGRLLPRAKRVFLRSPTESGIVYLVSFEFKGDILVVSIGNNLLRRV